MKLLMSCRKFQFSTRKFQFDFSPLRYFHITDTNYKISLSTVPYNHYGSRLNVGLLRNSFLSLVFYCIHLQRVKFAESNHKKSDQTRGNLGILEVKTSFFLVLTSHSAHCFQKNSGCQRLSSFSV